MTTQGQPRRRISVTLFDAVADHLDAIGERLATNRPETIRRALNCLDFQTGLKPTEQLMVRDTETGALERVRFQ